MAIVLLFVLILISLFSFLQIFILKVLFVSISLLFRVFKILHLRVFVLYQVSICHNYNFLLFIL